MKTPPYNTGKVLIGSRYDPPVTREITPEEFTMQSVLLGDKPLMTQLVCELRIYFVVLAMFVVGLIIFL
jgi:hypothetical protein